jgi:hypothetical protein
MITGFEADHVKVARLPEVDGKFVDEKTTALMAHCFTFKANGLEEGKRSMETVVIAGKKLDCTVYEFTRINKDPTYTARLTIWRASTVQIPYREILPNGNLALPKDSVKVQLTFEDAQQRSEKATSIIEDFAAKLKVGTRELTCVVDKWHLEKLDPKAGKTVLDARIWHSSEVPGCMVKAFVEGSENGKTTVTERTVIDYQATKRQP